MFQKSLLILAIAAACTCVQAQSTPAKKDLVARILKVQQPGMENMARELVSEPAGQIMARAGNFLQTNVPADKQQSLARDIEGDVHKFVDDLVPVVRADIVKVAPATIGTLLEDKFTEDELKQIAAMMESPVFAKFQALGGEMQKVLADKVIADTRPQVEARYKQLDETIGRRLQPYANAGGQAPAGKAPAAAAGKPPAKK